MKKRQVKGQLKFKLKKKIHNQMKVKRAIKNKNGHMNMHKSIFKKLFKNNISSIKKKWLQRRKKNNWDRWEKMWMNLRLIKISNQWIEGRGLVGINRWNNWMWADLQRLNLKSQLINQWMNCNRIQMYRIICTKLKPCKKTMIIGLKELRYFKYLI